MIIPDEDTYRRDALSFTVIPVAREIRADFETPLSLFLKCGGQFLLESIERGENVGRYSFIARGTKTRITLIGRKIVIEDDSGRPPRRMTSNANPLDEVRDYMNALRSPTYEGLPRFSAGRSATWATRRSATSKMSPSSRTRTESPTASWSSPRCCSSTTRSNDLFF
ncbi:MAG: hypothetical protein MUQ00_01745 [Candidatus Aminicenantes bacterium]|nr:hypothetical protein [Candidatus Aminicenantes bacterium]